MKISSNKIFVSVFMLFILFSIFPSELSAKARGAEVVITRIDNSLLSGELIAVKADSILVLNAESGIDASIPIKNILTVKLIKKANPLRGAGRFLSQGRRINVQWAGCPAGIDR